MSKIKKLVIGAIALVTSFVCGSAVAVDAPTPVAVWSGDFNILSKGAFTLDTNGNTIAPDGSSITIDQSLGVAISATGTSPFGAHCSTMILEFSDYANPSSGNQLLLANTDSNPVYHGIVAQSDGNAQAYWNTGLWGDGKITDGSFALSSSTTHTLAIAWRRSSGTGSDTDQGTKIYLDGTLKANWTGLFGQYSPDNLAIGGPIVGKNIANGVTAATGMKIKRVAIFNSKLSADEIAAYQFPAKYTGKVISFNIAQMSNNGQPPAGEIPATAQTTVVGTIPQNAWSQGTSSSWLNQSNFTSFKVYDLNNPASDPVDISMSASWSANNATNYGRGGADGVTTPGNDYYYLDCWLCMKNTSDATNTATMTINPPSDWSKYDLILYFNGSPNNSRSNYCKFTLNNTNYSVDENGAPIANSEVRWGARNQTTAVLGKNAVKFENMDATTIRFSMLQEGGAGIAAFQIVERAAVQPIQPGTLIRWGNTGSASEVKASTATSRFSFKIPGTAELPEGSIVRIKKVRIATTHTDWNVQRGNTTRDSEATYINLNNIQSGVANGKASPGGLLAEGQPYAKIASNAETSDFAANYEFSGNVDLVVGTNYPAPAGNTKDTGLCLLHSNGNLNYGGGDDVCAVRLVNSGVGNSIITTSKETTGYNPVYEIIAEVVSNPACETEAEMEDDAITVTAINALPALADVGPNDTVKLTLIGSGEKTLYFDDEFKGGSIKVVYDGALKLNAYAAPIDFAKYNFDGVASLDYAWIAAGSGMAINFNQEQGKIDASADSNIPDLPLKGACWNNTSGKDGSVDAVIFAPGGEVLVADTTAKVSWSSATTYQGTGASGFLNGYIDDGNPSPTIKIDANVPFGRYDVLIFAATDMSNCKFRPFKVNGEWYTWSDSEGKTVIGSQDQDWGVSRQTAPIYGKNTLRVINQTSSALTIEGLPRNGSTSRGCIAAIVIVKPIPEVKATATLEDQAEVAWSGIVWDNGVEPSETIPAEITVNNGASIYMDGAVNAKSITIKGTGAVSISDDWFTAPTYNVGKIISEVQLTVSTTSSLNVDAGANALTYFYGGDGTISPAITCSGAFKIGSGNITLSNDTINGLTGTMVIDGGAVATVNAAFTSALNRKLLGMTSGDGTLKLPVNKTEEIQIYSDSSTITANVNVEYTGSGELDFVGSNRPATDKFTVSAGKTVTFDGGTFWNKRGYFYIDGTLSAKNIKSGHEAGGDYPGNFYISNDGTLKTESITFSNGGGSDTDANRSTIEVGGTLEITGSGITKTSGAKNLIKFNGGSIVANESSWTTAELNLEFVDETATTFEVADGNTVTLNGTVTGSGTIAKTGAGALNLSASYAGAITLSGGLINRTAENTVTIAGDIDLGETEMPLSWTIDAASAGTLKLPAGFPFGQIAKASAIPEGLAFKDSTGATISADKLEIDGGYIVLKKSEITTPYNVAEPTVIEDDLTFGEGGSINITHNGAFLMATGTIELPASGLPVTFVCEDEYVIGTQILVVIASAFKIGDNDATLLDFNCKLTGKLPKGMAGEFVLVESEGKQALAFGITKSDYYTEDVAMILEDESLIRRFDASRGVTTGDNNKVTAWADLCGTAAAAAYTANYISDTPTFVNGELREYLDFGACNSHIDLGFEPVDNNARTVIEVIDLKNDGRAWLMGDRQVYNFHRDQSAAGSTKCFNNNAVEFSVRDNGTDAGNGKSYILPEGFRVVSMTTSANCSTDCFSGDRGGADNRSGGRKLSEVLIFNKVLTVEELATVEGYLTAKWNLALKNTATISGEQNWSTINWTAGKFYADAPTEITLGDNARLVYDAAAPVGNITFVKGDYTLEQVITSATGLSGDFTVPAGETFVFKGGEASTDTFTFSDKVTVNGILKTEGYVDLSNNGNTSADGCTFEIVTGVARIRFADRGMKGTLTIDAGATLQPYGYVDAINYDGNTTVNVYGTLDMSDSMARWTLRKTNTMNFYAGSTCSGNGQSGANTGALQFNNSNECVLNFKKNGEVGGTIEFSAKLHAQNAFTMNVEEGVTVNMSGSLGTGKNPFTLTGAGTINLTSDYEFNAPVTISEGTTLAIDGGSFAGGYTNNGTIELKSGTLNLGTKREFGAFKTDAGTTLAFTSSLAEDGKFSFKLAEGSVLPTVTLDGVTIENPTFENNTITFTYTPSVKGEACWMDYEFDGDLSNVGSDKTSLTRDQDGGRYIYGNPATSDFRPIDGTEPQGYDALYAGSHPWRNISAWPENFSCAMFGTLPEFSHSCLFAFGSTTSGTKGGIALMTGDVAKNEVLLVKWTGGNGDKAEDQKYETMATMSVPNAYTASHLYIFVKEGKSVKVYLDGMIWTTYTSETDFKMGTGFQICSVHGGSFSTGINRFYPGVFDGCVPGDPTTYDPRSYTCVIEALRLYNGVIGENAIAELKKEFKYVSPNGNAEREVATADGTWVQDNAWTLTKDGEVSTADQPLAGSALTLVAKAADAALTVNLEGEVSYEAVTINGADDVDGATLTIKSDTGAVINAGQTTINVPLTIEAGAMTIFGGPTFIKGEGEVTFDYTNYNFKEALTDDAGFIQLTGILDEAEADLVTVELPENDKYFTLEAAYDTASTTYRINYTRKTTEVTIPEVAGATASVVGYTIDEDGKITVKNGDSFTLKYTANADENKLFSDGTTEKTLPEFTDVTEAPVIDVSGISTVDAKAKIGSTLYLTLKAAVEAVQDEPTTVIAIGDQELTEKLEVSGKTITIDGDTFTEIDGQLRVVNGANVTIGSYITLTSDKHPTVFVRGETAKSTLTINGFVYNTNEEFDATFAISGNGNDAAGADIIVNGNVVNVNGAAIYFPQPGTLTLTDNAMVQGYSAIIMKDGTLNVADGATVDASGTEYIPLPLNRDGATPTGDAIVAGYYPESYGYGVPVLNITGGTFTTTAEEASGVNGYEVAPAVAKGNILISGGTFDKPVNPIYCKAGFIPADNGEGNYGVKHGFYIAYESEYGTAPATKAVDATEVESVWQYTLTAEDLPNLGIDTENNKRFVAWDKAVGDVITEDTTLTATWEDAEVEVVIPAIDGATPAVAGYEIKDGKVSIPYGSDLKVVYTANGNKLFSDGATTKEFEFTNVKADPGIDVSGISTVDAEAKTGGMLYLTLKEAIDAAGMSGEVELLKNVELEECISVSKPVSLNIGAFKITPKGPFTTGLTKDALFAVNYGGGLGIIGTGGSIDSSSQPSIYSAIKLTEKGETSDGEDVASLTVNEGVTIKGYYYGICGNGTRGYTEITINEGATIRAAAPDTNLAIFNPQPNSTVMINGGTLIGLDSAIEMRGGSLEIYGGTLTATATDYDVEPSGSGNTTKGAAVAVAQHNTKGEIYVLISDAVLKGVKAVSVANPQGNDTDNVSVELGYAIYNGALAFDADGNATVWVEPGIIELPEGYLLDAEGYLVKATAKIGTTYYLTLAEAVTAVEAHETIDLLEDVTIGGITIPSGKNFVLEFNEKTITFECPGAGSAGTKTIGFQILEGSTVIFQNGTIQCSEANKDATWTKDSTEKGIAMLIQNYANLSLEKMTIDGTNIAHNGVATRYVMSINSGAVSIYDSIIKAADGDFAFDTCKYGKYNVPTITVDGSTYFGSSIEGNVELSGGNLKLVKGSIDGELVDGGIGDGVIIKSTAFDVVAPDGYVWNDEGYLIKASAKIGSIFYLTLADAVKAAKDNETVELLASCTGDGIKIDKSITIDFGGFVYTVDASLVGSPSTQSQAFNLVSGKTITLKNGTITSKVARMLVQNYANLTLEDMILDGSELAAKNGKGNDYVAYTLSNCDGDTVITGWSVILARSLEGQKSFAFDTYYKAGTYEDATVTVDDEDVTIMGDIELAGGSLALNAGTLNGSLVAGANIEKGTVTKADAFEADAPAGYLWKDGVLIKATAKIGTEYYLTIQSAIDAAEDGAIIEIVGDPKGEVATVTGKVVYIQDTTTFSYGIESECLMDHVASTLVPNAYLYGDLADVIGFVQEAGLKNFAESGTVLFKVNCKDLTLSGDIVLPSYNATNTSIYYVPEICGEDECTLDLNGHKISQAQGLPGGYWWSSVYVNCANLTITDSSVDESGVITGIGSCVTVIGYKNYGGVDYPGKLTLEAGTLTLSGKPQTAAGKTYYAESGVVAVFAAGEFVMNGGTIDPTADLAEDGKVVAAIAGGNYYDGQYGEPSVAINGGTVVAVPEEQRCPAKSGGDTSDEGLFCGSTAKPTNTAINDGTIYLATDSTKDDIAPYIPEGKTPTVIETCSPEAKVEPTTAEGFDFAFIYTAMNDAPLYNDAVASFVIKADKAIPADTIKIGGKFATMGWNVFNLPAIGVDEEYTIVEATWEQVKAISPFTCGAASIALEKDTDVTLILKLDDDVIDTQTVTLKAVDKLPEVEVEEITPAPAELDTAATFSLVNKGINYDDWNADFIVTFDKDIAAGDVTLKGQYGNYPWTALPDTTYEKGVGKGVMATLGKEITVAELAALVPAEFNCGVVNNKITSNVGVTVQLVITDGETVLTVGDVFEATLPANIKPTATTTPVEITGCDAAVKYAIGTGASAHYNGWNVDFIVMANKDVAEGAITLLGSNPLDGETMVEFPAFPMTANEPISLLASQGISITYEQLMALTDGTYTCGVRNNSLTASTDFTLKIVLTKEGKESIVVEGSTFETTLDSYAARIGTTYYLTLEAAIDAVQSGETIELLSDLTIGGITIPSGKNFTMEFALKTITFECPGAGSTNTKTCGFQILEGSTVIFQNGTIQCSEANKSATWTKDSTEKGIAMVIQNYADLTLKNMQIDGTNIAHNGVPTRYVMSNNSGTVAIEDSYITAAEGDFAFDTCKYGTYAIPSVTVGGEFGAVITGKVELSGGNLDLVKGTIDGEIVPTAIGDGIITKSDDFNAAAPAGYLWYENILIADVKPEASVEEMDPLPTGLAAAATFTVTKAGSVNYADYTATFTLTANNDVAQDEIVLSGQYTAWSEDWFDMPLESDLTAGEPYTIIAQDWEMVASFVETFNCGLKNIKLAKDTTFKVTLTVAKDADKVITLPISFDVPAAKILPTATVTPIEVTGLDAAAKFAMAGKGISYDNWKADFIVTFDKDIAAGDVTLKGQYGEYDWTALPDTSYEANVGKGVMATLGAEITVAQLAALQPAEFNCGVVNNKIASNVGVKVQLVITDGETVVAIGEPFEATLPAAAIVPTMTVAPITPAPFGLDTAATFSLVDKGNGYGDWNADFIVTFDKDIEAGEITLKGQYDAFGQDWVDLPATDYTANVGKGVMATLGASITVDELAAMVPTFNCGIKNNTLTTAVGVKVQLVITKDDKTIKIGEPFAATLPAIVAKIGTTYFLTLNDAINAAKNGDKIELLADVETEERLEIAGKAITLDLGESAITYTGATQLKSGVIGIHNGAGLTIEGTTGGIYSGDNAYAAIALTLKGDTPEMGTASIDVKGGNLVGYYYGITGNGSRSNTAIIVEGGTIKGTCANDGVGIYHPEDGAVKIIGGTIEGAVAMYVKAGTNLIEITGGEFIANGNVQAYDPKGSGFVATGDALVVDNMGYPGGTPNIVVKGGTYTSANGYAIASYAKQGLEPVKSFVSNGYFKGGTDTFVPADVLNSAGSELFKQATLVDSTTKLGYKEIAYTLSALPDMANDAAVATFVGQKFTADDQVKEFIDTVEEYNALRNWAKINDGVSALTAEQFFAAKDIYFSYATDQDAIVDVDNIVQATTVKVIEVGTDGEVCQLKVSITGLTVGIEATPENLKNIYKFVGSDSLLGAYELDNVEYTDIHQNGGNVDCTIKPDSAIYPTTPKKFFYKTSIQKTEAK